MLLRGSLPTPEESQPLQGRFTLARQTLDRLSEADKDGDWQKQVLDQLIGLTGWIEMGYLAARRKQ
jgi:hypothetical protein